MQTLLLIPILLYLVLMLLNGEIFLQTSQIQLFWYTLENVPFLLVSALFMLGWMLVTFLAYGGVNSYLRYKNRQLDREIVNLKSQLYDGQSRLIEAIEKHFDEAIENNQDQNNQHFARLIEYNQYTLEKIITEQNLKYEKYKQESQKLLGKEPLHEEWLIEKIKKWR